jgi:hypothetical protein
VLNHRVEGRRCVDQARRLRGEAGDRARSYPTARTAIIATTRRWGRFCETSIVTRPGEHDVAWVHGAV